MFVFFKLSNKDIDFEKKIRPCCIDNKKRNQAKINIILLILFVKVIDTRSI